MECPFLCMQEKGNPAFGAEVTPFLQNSVLLRVSPISPNSYAHARPIFQTTRDLSLQAPGSLLAGEVAIASSTCHPVSLEVSNIGEPFSYRLCGKTGST